MLVNVNSIIVTRDVLSQYRNVKISPKLAFKLFKLVNAIEVIGQEYDTKLLEIIEKFGARDEKNNLLKNKQNDIIIQKNKVEECQKEIQQLQEKEVAIPEIKFSLGELEPLKFSVADIAALQYFIREE